MINQVLILQALPLPKVFQYRNYKVKQIKLMQNDNSIVASQHIKCCNKQKPLYISGRFWLENRTVHSDDEHGNLASLHMSK